MAGKIIALILWLAGLVIASATVLFALMNRSTVSVMWSPFSTPQDIPVFLPAVVFMTIGFCLGAVCVWLNNNRQRQEKRNLKKQIKDYEHRLYGTSSLLSLPSFTGLSELPKKD